MAYIILTANGEELQRVELSGPVLIGRAAECDVVVRDVLLSRKHCRLERGTGKDKGLWKLVDLDSRNGTHVNWKKVSQYTLVDGDAVRLGRTWLTFKAGVFAAAGADVKKRITKLVRPADPHEALNGTVSDFVFVDRDDQNQDFDGTPSPHGIQPMGGKAIYSPLSELSNSWDSIVATAVRPKRMAHPIPRSNASPHGESRMDLSLQAHPIQVPYLEMVEPIVRRRMNLMPAVVLAIGIGLATLLVLVSGWVMTRG